jgi:predicted small secreted protein
MKRSSLVKLLAVALLLGAANLSCNATVGVGFSVPVGGGWGGGPYGSVGVGFSVPIGH